MPTVEDLNRHQTEVRGSNLTSKQLEYQRKSMCMALVMHVVRSRGDESPNDYDIEHYEFFVKSTENMIKDNELGHTLQAYIERPETGREIRGAAKIETQDQEAERKVNEAAKTLKATQRAQAPTDLNEPVQVT